MNYTAHETARKIALAIVELLIDIRDHPLDYLAGVTAAIGGTVGLIGLWALFG